MAQPADQRLRRRERIAHQRDFDRLHARRCRVRGQWLMLAGCENGLPYSRLGLAVGRRWGKAHDRVRLKRLYREAFRLEKHRLPTGLDLLFTPAQAESVTLARLRPELVELAPQLARKLTKSRIGNDGSPSVTAADVASRAEGPATA